jgi:hypothetical protein
LFTTSWHWLSPAIVVRINTQWQHALSTRLVGRQLPISERDGRTDTDEAGFAGITGITNITVVK